MTYLGSKRRISKHIIPIMLKTMEHNGITTYAEPFVGGANSIDKIPLKYKRIGVDINPHTIAALTAVRDMPEQIPESLTKEEYMAMKGTEPDPIKSLLRFTCSFAGKLDAGYARERGSDPTTYPSRAKRNALKQSPNIQGLILQEGSYQILSPLKNTLIYCDPPYKGTTSYKTVKFDHEEFYSWCLEMSKDNIVFLSEYEAPKMFTQLWEKEINIDLPRNRDKASKSTEKLFTLNPDKLPPNLLG